MINIFLFHNRYPVYKARKQLTAIDWNYHKDVPARASTTYAGEVAVTRKYNARTMSWDAKVIKCKKDYSYIMLMVAKSLDMRISDKGSVTRPVELSGDDPRLISPTIGAVEPEASRDLQQRKISRF